MQDDEEDAARSRCPVCRNPFTYLSHHLYQSPLCRHRGRPTVSSTPRVLPSAVTGPMDDLVDAPLFLDTYSNADSSTPEEEAPTYDDLEEAPPVPDPDADLDADDYEMVFNDPSVVATTLPVKPPLLLLEDPESQCCLESGKVLTVPSDYGKGQYCYSKKDRTQMRLYNICNEAGAPLYLLDKLLAQMKIEMGSNPDLNLLQLSSFTKRKAFMSRMHRKFPSPPPEAILVELESFDEPVTVYRFNAMDQLQRHLLRKDLYGDITKLNVNQTSPFDQSLPVPPSAMREITDGTWHPEALLRHLCQDIPMDDLGDTVEDIFEKFLLTFELYTDGTGTDQKETNSLEPVVMCSGLLMSCFNSNHRSRVLLGYMPNLKSRKSAASQTRRSGTQAGYGCGVRDYHKCLSIILQPLVEAQQNPPTIDILLGDQVCRRRLILLMGFLLGDGKSQDMATGRVAAFTNTFRLCRAAFIPSDIASDTDKSVPWIKTAVIEHVVRAAMFDPMAGRESLPYDLTIEWNLHLSTLPTLTEKRRHVAGAKRRVNIATNILNKALGTHKVRNAFFSLDCGSPYGIFGHTLADLMHCLEEGIIKYLLGVFLDPLSISIKESLDDLVTLLLSAKANRCFGRRLFPRLNFTRGYSRLTLLSSEERTGAFLALILVLVTDRGQAILGDRFAPRFDEKRKERARQFKGGKKRTRDDEEEVRQHQDDSRVRANDGVHANDAQDEEESDQEMPPMEQEHLLVEDQELVPSRRRTKQFVPTRKNIHYICKQIRYHDLGFLFTEVFPEIPTRHVHECLKIIWELTYRLSDDIDKVALLPLGVLNTEPFRKYSKATDDYGRNPPVRAQELTEQFCNDGVPSDTSSVDDEDLPVQSSITTDPKQFLKCCEHLLLLRSFFNYSGEHCPNAVPMKEDGSLNFALVEQRTRQVGEYLKGAVNRGNGTNNWRIPKFIDMLLLPEYMQRLGSTGRFHVGFCERGLKPWAKFPANTAQKQGGGIFEGQCASRIRDKAMMDLSLTAMDSGDDEADAPEDSHGDESDAGGIAGAFDQTSFDQTARVCCFRISIVAEGRQKSIICTRLNSYRKRHSLQFELPKSILAHFKKEGHRGEVYEYRTEAVVEGTLYRAHPNYRGKGPWYDFVMVRIGHDCLGPGYVDDNHMYPAKLLGFFRNVTDVDQSTLGGAGIDFSVLVHCGAYQTKDSAIYARRTLLTRSWLYEMKTPGTNPQPNYMVAGTTRTNIVLQKHIFGMEEIPGLHQRYDTQTMKRFVVLSDMRTDWPQIFIDG
jgi:hypothetical protein